MRKLRTCLTSAEKKLQTTSGLVLVMEMRREGHHPFSPSASRQSPSLSSPVTVIVVAKLSNRGGRLIISFDGIRDALSSEEAANLCRGLPAELAARQVVKEALSTRSRGLKDDTTCIIVDIIPPDNSVSV
ncbi:hypothetical protein ACLB2K_072375 [Fragaria x ananassa]